MTDDNRNADGKHKGKGSCNSIAVCWKAINRGAEEERESDASRRKG